MLSRNIASKQANKDEGQSRMDGGGGCNTSSLRPPEQTLKCPRCNSSNTKFCYYNNYSLAQPRHFCKACRRYWTKGGALRNVPIGGSCRKNNKTIKSCSSKPSLDFQLNQFSSSYGDTSISTHSFVNLDPLGYNMNIPFSSSHIVMKQANHQQQQHDLASSIESLSSINQDLHWKLQKQRLAMLFGDSESHHDQKLLQPILFQNLETSKQAQSSVDGDSRKETVGGCGLATEWFFDNTTSTNSNGGGSDQNGSMNNWNGIQAWNHLNQYNSVP